MAKKQCGKCDQEINDLEPMRCGFCEAFFHTSQTCCGINARSMKEAFSSGKAILICHSCRDELKGRSIRRYIAELETKQNQPADSPILNALPAQVQQLSDVVAELTKKIDVLSAKPQRDRSVSVSSAWPRLGTKRRREDRPNINVPITKGTKSIHISDLSVPSITATAPPEKFWLYLSRLNPLITDKDVLNIVSRCLCTTDHVDVVRLVPKGKDVTGMTFVSFKIGLDPCVKDLALDPSSWPDGLQFREFVNLTKN